MVRGRMGTRYEFLQEFARPVDLAEGHSGYFATPDEGLDPRLFIEGTEQMRPEIRTDLLRILYGYWETKYAAAEEWSEVWLAGSAVSYSWGEREKGDLDVLIGIDLPVFFRHNPHLKAFPEKVLAQHMNAEFREDLWPMLEDYAGGAFEVTYYFNPSTGRDIRRINPYAAYNLKTDVFDVQPIDLPEDWGAHHIPDDWHAAVQAEIDRGRELVERYNTLARELQAAPEGPRRVNIASELGLVVDQISTFYEEMHADRRNAYQGRFGVKGEGFVDYFNFRWQAWKKSGIAQTMNAIRKTGNEVERERQTFLYGAPPSADVLTPVTLKDYL